MMQTDTDTKDQPLLRRCDLDLIARAEEIQQEDPRESGSIGFMTRAMVQATMPHRDPRSNEFRRRNGNYTLIMMAPAEIGLPYGALPRLILSWVSTEAVRTRRPDVVLGDSLAAFMRELGLTATGGRRGTIPRVKQQIQRLFSTSISCIYSGESHWANVGFRIADETRLWWHPKDPDQLDLWHSRVILGASFFQDLIDHPVPVDTRALKALRRSPLALDIYCWLTHRMSYLRKATLVPWSALAEQFGADYGREDNFRAAFLDALRKVLTVYCLARVLSTPIGLLLEPSQPHVGRAQHCQLPELSTHKR